VLLLVQLWALRWAPPSVQQWVRQLVQKWVSQSVLLSVLASVQQ
jgi:hypothetical protein